MYYHPEGAILNSVSYSFIFSKSEALLMDKVMMHPSLPPNSPALA